MEDRAIPVTHDAAVLSSSVLFVTTQARHLHVLRNTIRQYEKRIHQLTETHLDFPIVSSFPGLGPALAPQLIAALGAQRGRFANAHQLPSYSGIAPVQKSSDKRCGVHVRWACPKFVRQTFQEWAQHSPAPSAWARV
ncbi:MAG TPA: transposase [Bryobacteraceae bacterium]